MDTAFQRPSFSHSAVPSRHFVSLGQRKLRRAKTQAFEPIRLPWHSKFERLIAAELRTRLVSSLRRNLRKSVQNLRSSWARDQLNECVSNKCSHVTLILPKRLSTQPIVSTETLHCRLVV